MNLLLNLLWLILGGFLSFLGYLVVGLLLCLTIIGIPWGLQAFKLASFVFWPFGRDSREIEPGRSHEVPNMLGNIIWLLLGGIGIVLSHLIFGLVLCITIIGIPFGIQHFKFARLAFLPFGRSIRSIR
jgi:uncharacterized membrane protein YccF (DUF307 family)